MSDVEDYQINVMHVEGNYNYHQIYHNIITKVTSSIRVVV